MAPQNGKKNQARNTDKKDWRRDETEGVNLGTEGDSDDVADSPERGIRQHSVTEGDSDDQGDDKSEGGGGIR